MDQKHISQLVRWGAIFLAFALLLGTAEPLAVSAKQAGKRHKAKTVTRTFSIRDRFAIPEEGASTRYPTSIDVSGFKRSRITDVNLFLSSFSHANPADVDVLLVSPDGRNALVMSDAGDGFPVSDLGLRFDDEAAAELPDGDELEVGTFRPTNLGGFGTDDFPAPAPELSRDIALSTFNGEDPNGQWTLFIVDDQELHEGGLSNGWELEITAKKLKKKKRNGGRR